MAIDHLAVTCTLDRVGPLDTADQKGFSLNLSASFVAPAQDPEAAELAFFETWKWKVETVALWGRPAGGAWTLIDPALPVLRPPARDPLPDEDPLAAEVRARITAMAKDGEAVRKEAVVWSPLDPPQETEEVQHVRHLLASLSTRTAPVPHALGLAFLLRVPAGDLAGVDEVVAVPVFGDGSLGARGPENVAAQLPLENVDRKLFTIEYEDVTGKPAIVAYLLPAAIAIDHTDFFVDLETGWVKAAPGSAGADWTLHLEQRAAHAFDLAQRLVDALREGLGEPNFQNMINVPAFRKTVLALARDLAGVGIGKAPDGLSLADEVRERAGISPVDWQPVADRLALFDPSLPFDAWRALVAAQIPEVAGLAAVQDPEAPRPVEQLADELTELEQLQSALADDLNLRRLVQAQWQAALASLDPALQATVLRALESHLAETSPRQRLAHANLGPVWSALVSLDRTPPPADGEPARPREADERAELEARLAEQLRAALRQRLPAALGPLAPFLLASLTRFAETFTDQIRPENEDSPTPVPHGISLQLDRLGAVGDAADVETERKDLQHALAGFGVLLRREAGDWRCLTMASLALESGPELAPAVPAPYRLGYRNGMRETAVTYNNHPLAAKSPAVGLAGEADLSPEGSTADQDDPLWNPLLRHDPVALPPGDAGFKEWARLPALQFGRRYEAAPFAVTNAGILPRGLGRDDDPTRLRDFRAGEVPASVLRPFRYLRRVPVGAPRYGAGIGETGTVDQEARELIPIPASVAPIAREVEIPGLREGEEIPLLLLAPESWRSRRNAFPPFPIRKPAADLNTWDRWVGRDEATRPLRINVWAWYHRNAPKELGIQVANDLTIDDPAVDDAFLAELRAVPVPGRPTPADPPAQVLGTPEATVPAGQEFLEFIRRGAARVKCEIGSSLTFRANGPNLQVTVLEGQLWVLSIHPRVAARFFDDGPEQRFHPALKEGLRKEGDFYLLAPFRLLIETAADGLRKEDAEVLWQKLEPKALGSRIALHLDGGGPAFPFVSRVEVRRQVWRWNGRPFTTPFPFAAATPERIDTVLRAWEAEAFAERPDDDCARTVTAINLKQTQPLLCEEDRSTDARALLYRFGLVAFSRYAGLGVPRESVTAEHLVEGNVKTPWRRLLHRCRWTEAVPKPKVKLVVPLTEAPRKEEDTPPAASLCALPPRDNGAAGLLVVLNEPWYEIGGLAEGLEVELATADLKDGEGTILKTLPEIGPDPILTGRRWPESETATFNAAGPIGHTFDTGSGSPLFVSSSFILPPPTVAGQDLSWHFAKLRFRRTLDPAALAVAPPKTRSEPTDPYWVQLLPDASAYRVREIGGAEKPHLGLDDLAIGSRADGTFQLVTKRGGQPVRLEPAHPPQASDADRFFHVLLVTQRIFDAGGHREEKYIGLFRFDGAVWQRLDGSEPIREGDELRARVVEMQERQPRPAAASLPWTDLFPGEDADGLPQDAKLRIVRVSPPIASL